MPECPRPNIPPQSLKRMITQGRVECSQSKTTCYQLGSTPSARQASARGPVYAATQSRCDGRPGRGRGGGEVATSCPTRHLSLRKEDHGTAAREDLDFSMPRRYSLSNRQTWKDSLCIMGKFAPSRKPSGEVVATEGQGDVSLVP